MEVDCKSTGSAYGGSNPSLPTLEDWLSGLKQGIANPPIHAIMYPLVQIQHPPPWEISSVVEQCADNAEVGGSNPPFPT